MRCTFANTTEHRERFLLQYILRYAVISRETYLKGIYKSTKKLFWYFSSSSYATSNSSQLMEKHCVLRWSSNYYFRQNYIFFLHTRTETVQVGENLHFSVLDSQLEANSKTSPGLKPPLQYMNNKVLPYHPSLLPPNTLGEPRGKKMHNKLEYSGTISRLTWSIMLTPSNFQFHLCLLLCAEGFQKRQICLNQWFSNL